MKKILFLCLIMFIPMGIGAENITAPEADSMVTQMKSILDQYAFRIKSLEAENAILKEEIRKAGIKIPLSAYSWTIIPRNTTTGTWTNTWAINKVSASWTTASGPSEAAIRSINSQYGERYGSFIQKIHTDWSGIQWAYKLPTTAYIGWYEFVKQGWDNHVFVDIVNNISTATWSYDIKILYEYHTGTYQRKLIWFFELDRKTWFYTTKTGTNPFAGVTRTFVRDPSWTNLPSSSSTTSPSIVVPTYAEIEKAYSDKRYLSVISLSNSYLTINPPTFDLLRMRYRTYFIIGKYTESLAEIAKIELMWQLTSVACDWQVIATYSKNQSLIDKYSKACKQ